MTWYVDDTIIVLVGALGAMACAILGNFLILRKMSMMGDAISHTVLPGIAIAYIITGSRESWPMFLGACAVGVITVYLVHLVQKLGEVEEGASMGVIFTSLFAVGLVLIRIAADDVDIDPGCVLYGSVEYAPFNTSTYLGYELPVGAVTNGIFLLVNMVFVLCFYKELKLTSFDPAFASSIGIRSNLVHYILMTLVAATVVAAFEVVGSILVIAMLIIPGACAYLLTNRLSGMIVISLFIAALSAFLGHFLAIWLPIRFPIPETNSAGMMGSAVLGIFLLVALFAPQQGVLARILRHIRLALRITSDDVLAYLYRREELVGAHQTDSATLDNLKQTLHRGLIVNVACWKLRLKGYTRWVGGNLALTEPGEGKARQIVRSHRLWETFLVEKMGIRPDHVHSTAERLEHITDDEMRDRLARDLVDPTEDPQGKSIPPN